MSPPLLVDLKLRQAYRYQQCQHVRARRCSLDPAKRLWYAHWRTLRFAHHEPPKNPRLPPVVKRPISSP